MKSQHTCVIKIQIKLIIANFMVFRNSCESIILVYTAIQYITTCRFRFSRTKSNHKINSAKNALSHVSENQYIFFCKQ